MIERLLTVDEVLGWLRISRSSLYRLMSEAEIHPVYPDGKPKFEPSEIRRFLDLHRGYEHHSAPRGRPAS